MVHVVKQSVRQDDEDVLRVSLAWVSIVSGSRELQMTTFLLFLDQPKNIIVWTPNSQKLEVGRRTIQRHLGASIDEVVIHWNVCGMISERHVLCCLFFIN